MAAELRLGDLSAADVSRRLAGTGLAFAVGPFNFRVVCPIPEVAQALRQMYGAHPVLDAEAFCDCALELTPPALLRRWLRPQVQVRYDGLLLFEPLPRSQAYALLEWTMNWWISSQAHQYLILHAAVIERDGRAAILAAPPGSGKSTLCAALSLRGWRLLSDELALIDPASGTLLGMARPASLKNRSIDVIRAFEPAARFSAPAHDTAKGTVAHLQPKPGDVAAVQTSARPAWAVFPKYVPQAAAELRPRERADAMMELGRNAFNYALLGLPGFQALARVVDACACYDFSYSRLEDAVATFDTLAGQAR